MSKIIYDSDRDSDGARWHVYMTPFGDDEHAEEFVDSCESLAEAAVCLLEAMADEERKTIEMNRERIADHEKFTRDLMCERKVSDVQTDAVKAQEEKRRRWLLRGIHEELKRTLYLCESSFEELAEFHSDKGGDTDGR